MAETSKIEWTDATFNPWIGCTKVSPACDHCYAERSTPARTLGVVWGPHAERHRTSTSNWALPMRWEREHEAFFAQHGRRRRVFCASLADVFDNQVPHTWREDLWKLIEATPHLDWLILTKRIGIVATWSALFGWPANAWLGITVVNQEEADRDIPKLLEIPAAVRFLSIEPMLGPVDLHRLVVKAAEHPERGQPPVTINALRGWHAGPNWVICGGESGPNARPMHPDWARGLRDQCAAAGVAFTFKQWGEWAPLDGMDPELRIQTAKHPWRRMDGTRGVVNVGKKAAGRLLDGIEHNGFPS
jgi:protein gp37